jgi:hypothetical protein
LIFTLAVPAVADAQQAATAYRVAQRLLAEGSTEAGAALDQVLALDPEGPLADDALLDLALLQRPPAWPEELGRTGAEPLNVARRLLERLLSTWPGSERSAQARYLVALLWLEPQAGLDLAAARRELIAVATAEGGDAWSAPARYALGWMDGVAGETLRAEGAWSRVVVDSPESEAATRAWMALGRLRLRAGEPAEAARLLQRAVERGGGPVAASLRELALRRTFAMPLEVAHSAIAVSVDLPLKAITSFAAAPDGGAVVADRREGRVIRIDQMGAVVDEWSVPQVELVSTDPLGRAWAVAGDRLVRLAEGGAVWPRAPLGVPGVVDLVVDAQGAAYVLDRRGQRLFQLAPGAAGALPFGGEMGRRYRALATDGQQIYGLDARAREVWLIGASGERLLASEVGTRPVALAADASGRLAVLDSRDGAVVVLDAHGRRLAEGVLAAPGGSVSSIGFSGDGGLQIVQAARRWTRWP